MTINASAPKRQDFTGTGLSGPFPILVPIADKSQLKVVKTAIATGVGVTLVLDTDYTIESDLSDLYLTDPLLSTHKLTFLLQTVVEQTRDFLQGNPFPPDIFERVADDVTRHVIKISEQHDRAIRLSDGDPREGGVTIDPLVADKYVAVSSDASKLVMTDVAPDVDAYLATLLAGVPSVQIVQDNIAAVNTVAGIASSITTVAGMSSVITTVAGMAADISTVIGLTATMNAAIAASIPETQNYIWNGGMLLWRGYTGVVSGSLSARVRAVEGWSCAQVGFSADLRVSQLATGNFAISQFALQVGRVSGSTNVNDVNAVFNLSPEETFPLRGQTVVLGCKVRRGSNFSSAGNILTMEVICTTTAGVNIITNSDGSYSSGHSSLGSVNVALPSSAFVEVSTGSVTITVPSNAVQVAVRFRYTPTGTAGAADHFWITDVYLCRGVGSVRPRPIRQPLAMLHALRQWRRTCLPNDPFATPSNPGGVAGGGAALGSKAFSTDPTQLVWNMFYGDIPMHYAPTVTWFSPQGTTGSYGVSSTVTTGSASLIGATDSLVAFQGATGTPTVASIQYIGFEAEARL